MALKIILSASVPVAAILGVLSHLIYFIRGEHHTRAVRLLQAGLVAPIIAFVGLVRFGQCSETEAYTIIGTTSLAYTGSLFLSILTYRLFFHPLRNFPGPVTARVSKFWHSAHITNFDNYKLYERLGRKYGSYVRIGPSDLMITDVDAQAVIHGHRSKCVKGTAYDATLPLMSLHQTRDKAEHDRRRRVWDKAFSTKALRGYEGRVTGYTKLLVQQVALFAGQPLDASKWFNYYSFDVMGDLAFGRSFDMLKKGEKHFAIDLLHQGQQGLGILGPVPWLLFLMTRTPIVSRGYWTFVNWCEKQAEERRRMKISEPDLMSWLLEGEPMSSDPKVNQNWLAGDARLIIVAGSDTTAATLTHIFYHLAAEPEHIQKIRDEIAISLGPDAELSETNLRDLKHLNGIIDETLRLHPPVPGGVARQSPPEGIQIGDTFIPGGTGLVMPSWTIMRSPKYFKHPGEFIPERWYSKPELVLEPSAFAPFLTGRYSCIGKNLAYMELRAVVATLVTTFDISFGPGEDGSKLINDTKDCFTLVLAPLMLKFTPRT